MKPMTEQPVVAAVVEKVEFAFLAFAGLETVADYILDEQNESDQKQMDVPPAEELPDARTVIGPRSVAELIFVAYLDDQMSALRAVAAFALLVFVKRTLPADKQIWCNI